MVQDSLYGGEAAVGLASYKVLLIITKLNEIVVDSAVKPAHEYNHKALCHVLG